MTTVLSFIDDNHRHDQATIRMPLGELVRRLRQADAILEMRVATVRQAAALLVRTPEIWPDQCDRLSQTISALVNDVSGLADLLHHTDALPEAAIPIHYETVLAAHYAADRLERAEMRIRELRAVCRSRPGQAIKQRNDAQRRLENALDATQDLRRETKSFTDRARFHIPSRDS